MGFWDFFTNSPTQKAIQSQKQKAKEKYAQPEYRRMAMEKLLKWNTDESLMALLERWSVVVQSPHWDEDEKNWLVDEMVKMKDRAKPLLKKFIMQENEVNHALIAYRKLCTNEDEYIQVITQALNKRLPEDHRSVQSKQELIAALYETNFSQADIFLPYLQDHSDDVRCITLDALISLKLSESYPHIINMLQNQDNSARVLRHAALAVEKLDILLPENLVLANPLPEDFKIQNHKLSRLT